MRFGFWPYFGVGAALAFSIIILINWAGDIREHKIVAKSATEAAEKAREAIAVNTEQDVQDLIKGAKEAAEEQERYEEVRGSEIELDRAIATSGSVNDGHLPNNVAECLYQHALAVQRYISGTGADETELPGGCTPSEPGFVRSPRSNADIPIVREAAIERGSIDVHEVVADGLRSEHAQVVVVAGSQSGSADAD